MGWFMSGLSIEIRRLQTFVALRPVLTLILVVDVAAYFGGLIYWYGGIMGQPITPFWAWLFIPDCPLFGLLGGLGLLMVTAQKFWDKEARKRTQRLLLLAGGASAILWLSTYLPGAASGWIMQRAMLAVWSWSLLIAGVFFLRAPAWLLTLIACGQVKYGVWTITAWLLFWQNTAARYGAPLFTFDSVFMTATHIGLVAQGVLLVTYYRPTWLAAVVSVGWFALSDFVDYGLGYYPPLPLQYIPLPIMQWSTVAMTFVLGGVMLVLGGRAVWRQSDEIDMAHSAQSATQTTKAGLP
jgi:uncharacterized membrane protein YpjA